MNGYVQGDTGMVDRGMGNQLLEISKRPIDGRNVSGGQRSGRRPSALNHNHINGKTRALLAVQITPDGEMLRNDILLVEGIEETSTFQAVVALRP
jgi:hypothetical protein